MKRSLPAIAMLLIIGLSSAQAEKKRTVVFEATVVRIDTWGLVKFPCGIAINYRLAEYKVDAMQSGRLTLGAHVVAKHLACKWNELDGIKVGDKVVVTAELLKHPETRSWQPTIDKNAVELINHSEPDETINIPVKSESVLVQCDVKKVAKFVYPSNP